VGKGFREGEIEMAGKAVVVFTLNGKDYSIRITSHALKRIKQRDIDLTVCIENILKLKVKDIVNYENSDEVAIIDKTNDITIIIGFDCNKINIITVIDKIAYIKDGTLVKKVA